MAALPGDTDGGTTVGNAICEFVNAASLMLASETHGVVLSVHCNVLLVAGLELLDRSFDVLHATRFAHNLAGEVAVQTRSIPVTRDRLGMERDLGTEFFGDTVEEETSTPEVVTH